MLKQLKSVKPHDAQEILETVRTNAHQVWLAGLGAFAAMQNEGTKVISTAQAQSAKVFASLVKQGQEIEYRAKKAAAKRATAVSDKTTQAIDKLEQVFQNRVSRSLNRLGVPSSEDVRALTARVEELTGTVKTLVEGKTSARAPRKAAQV